MSVETIPVPEDVVRGEADWRTYRPIQLPNGVTCMIVHDKESKTTAMATCVNVGAAADPRTLSGLAHFLEHMCFLGSEKYPGENEYKRYLSCHGGRSNASTSMHLTTYKFDVLAEHAEQAVDIFSNFFVSPLLSESGTSREVQAVDSEDSKNRTADGRRRLQILKALADPHHYYSKFTTGNVTTLPAKDDDSQTKWVRDALLAFHRHHYRPDNMTVTIVGPQSLDTLQQWVVPRFAAMKAKDVPPVDDRTEVEHLIANAAKEAPTFAHDQPEEPYNPAFRPELQDGTWPILLSSRPVRSMRTLSLNFPTPTSRRTPDQSPLRMLGHLLGHEGPGSAFAVLQNAGLISSLSAGPRVSGPDQCLFQINVALTEQGEERWQAVVNILFAQCRLLSNTAREAQEGTGSARGDLERIWGEIADISRIHFQQTSPGDAYGFAPSLCQSVVVHGTTACASAGNMLNEAGNTFPLEQFLDFSSRLIPRNCIVERCSQAAWDEVDTDKEKEEIDGSPFGTKSEKWYGVDYNLTKIGSELVTTWESAKHESMQQMDDESLYLPRANRYIPRTLELSPDLPLEATLGPRIEKNIDPPNLIINEKGVGRLWHRLDDRYALPKSSLTFLVRNAAVQNVRNEDGDKWVYDVENALKSSMLAGIFSEALAQETYDASLAGLYWSLSLTSSGIRVSCSGYSDRLPDLALKVLDEFFLLGKNRTENTEDGSFLKESYVASTKDRLVRSFRTYFQSRRADSHAMYYRDMLCSSEDDGIDLSLEVTEKMTLESLEKHRRQILRNDETEVECLFSGNVSEAQAKDFFSKASNILHEASIESKNASPSRVNSNAWVPGTFERRLVPGKDIEIHFASKNPEEENGAVLVTYQSSLPGYRGDALSSADSLKQSASIRLLCHMLREPLFDELRTKQQLGYVVSSYYDMGFSSRPHDTSSVGRNDHDAESTGPWTVPVDFIVVNVLSKAQAPTAVTLRIDEFMESFRERLIDMPESEILDHADALSQKLLKPIQKLGAESSVHFAKIRRYGPEVLASGGEGNDLPWGSVASLAGRVQSLERTDLLQVWDRVVADKQKRSRVVSCVYGTSFPLPDNFQGRTKAMGASRTTKSVVNNLDELLLLRKELKVFTTKVVLEPRKRAVLPELFGKLTRSKKNWGIAAAAVIGAGVVGMTVSKRYKRQGS